ncbi:MAG: universal stress protein, partial [Deltaproteobacteria bacterium]
IRELVKREKIDLTFVATRREDVKKRFYLKTLARKLVLKLPCSVAMVRVVRMGKAHARHILVPLRGHMSSLDERACFVAKLAQGFGAEVTIFHTPKPITSFFHGELHLPPAQRERHVPKDVEQFTVCLSRHMIRHDKRTGYGRVPQTITIEAAHRRNDLIVMGASERSLFRSFVSGNPVEDVLRETPCNLIVFRPEHGP